jgi:hypothetical protein
MVQLICHRLSVPVCRAPNQREKAAGRVSNGPSLDQDVKGEQLPLSLDW